MHTDLIKRLKYQPFHNNAAFTLSETLQWKIRQIFLIVSIVVLLKRHILKDFGLVIVSFFIVIHCHHCCCRLLCLYPCHRCHCQFHPFIVLLILGSSLLGGSGYLSSGTSPQWALPKLAGRLLSGCNKFRVRDLDSIEYCFMIFT